MRGKASLNDASALLIYRIAVTAMTVGGITVADAAPMLLVSIAGSLILGPVLALIYMRLMTAMDWSNDRPSSIILQFIGTFGVWLLADRLGLSGILTIVAYAVTIARRAPATTSAHLRVPSYAVWETAVFVLNVVAFVLIGLQIGPIFETLAPEQRVRYLLFAAAVLATVILVRFAWVMSYNWVVRRHISSPWLPSAKADGGADRQERPHHLLVRHARYRHPGRGASPCRTAKTGQPSRIEI